MILATTAMLYFAPVVLEGIRADSVGFIYQGRYIFPLFAGLVVTAMFSSVTDPKGAMDSTVQSASRIMVLATVIAIVHVFRRYAVGIEGPIIWITKEQWLPYGGRYLAPTLFVVGTGLAFSPKLHQTGRKQKLT